MSIEIEKEKSLGVMKLSSTLLKLQCQASMEYVERALGEGEERFWDRESEKWMSKIMEMVEMQHNPQWLKSDWYL